jgi:hypothetical protein
MSRERRYLRLADWVAVRDLGHEDPGLRPGGDEFLPPNASLPPTSTHVNAMQSLRPDPEAAAEARSARVDELLLHHNIQPRRRRR